MSLKSPPTGPAPEETARVAEAAFPNGNPYLMLREKLGITFEDEDFAVLYPDCGQPAYAPWRLALITLLQFREVPSPTGKPRLPYAASVDLNYWARQCARL